MLKLGGEQLSPAPRHDATNPTISSSSRMAERKQATTEMDGRNDDKEGNNRQENVMWEVRQVDGAV